jgi:hypothetical protein
MKFKTQLLAIFKYLYLILLLILLAVSLKAQTVQWAQTYGGTGQDGGESMILTSDGGIVIAGFKSAGPTSYKDMLLMKTDASGNELWSRIFNLNLNDWARSIKQTSDGGFIISGMTEINPQTHDPFLLKTDNQGNLQWVHQYDYGFGEDDRAHTVYQTSDGGYILAGQTWLFHGPFGNYDMYIIKTDANGNVQWTKIFFREEQGGDVALGVQQLNDGGYIIGGFTQSSEWASYIIRTDDSGNPVWSNIYPGVWQSECYDIQSTPDGGFIYTGTESNFVTDTDVLLVKLNGSGVLQWKKIYGTVEADQGELLQQLPDGGFVIAGMSATQSTSYDMYVVRTNSSGDLLWSSRIGGTSDDRAFSVVTNPDGSHLISGWAWSYGQGSGDVYLVKIQDSVVPVELTNFSASVSGNDVVLNWSTATETNNRGFEIERKQSEFRSQESEWIPVSFVSGYGTTTETKSYSFVDDISHLLTLTPSLTLSYRLKQIDFDGSFEYSDVVEVDVENIPSQFSLEQNYPNPFNPSTKIKFTIPHTDNPLPGGARGGLVTLKVYNLLGNEIATLVNEEKSSGEYEVTFDASGLASGTYFYKLEAGTFSQVKKMILTK